VSDPEGDGSPSSLSLDPAVVAVGVAPGAPPLPPDPTKRRRGEGVIGRTGNRGGAHDGGRVAVGWRESGCVGAQLRVWRGWLGVSVDL